MIFCVTTDRQTSVCLIYIRDCPSGAGPCPTVIDQSSALHLMTGDGHKWNQQYSLHTLACTKYWTVILLTSTGLRYYTSKNWDKTLFITLEKSLESHHSHSWIYPFSFFSFFSSFFDKKMNILDSFKSYYDYYWTSKLPKIIQNSKIGSFFPQRQKKASDKGQSPPQEIEVGSRSRLYLLVFIKFQISKEVA